MTTPQSIVRELASISASIGGLTTKTDEEEDALDNASDYIQKAIEVLSKL